MNPKSFLKSLRGDTTVWFIYFALLTLSILVVYSASAKLSNTMDGGQYEITLVKHVRHVIIGLIMAYITYRTPYERFKSVAPWLLIASVVLLLFTMLFGVEISSARRWLDIPFTNIRFQPSDFAKIGLIVYLARAISMHQDNMKKGQKRLLLPLIAPVVIICGLIAPSDLSTALVLFFTCIVMLFIGRLPMSVIFKFLIYGVVLFTFMIVIGMLIPEAVRFDTWATRLEEFFGNEESAQVFLSKVAIANGGVFGQGAGMSVHGRFIPTSHADYIFPVFVEEYGLIGAIGVIVLYISLFIRSFSLLTKSTKLFGAIMAIGLSLLIVIQALTNMAVAVNLFPVTGLTLPIISRGGTSLVFTSIAFGLILSVSRMMEKKGKSKIVRTTS